MDIEGYEWGVLEGLARSGASMLPFSISVELHAWTEVKEVPWQGRWRGHEETAEWMATLLTHGGYALVDRHDNPRCAYCSEVVLARLLAPARHGQGGHGPPTEVPRKRWSRQLSAGQRRRGLRMDEQTARNASGSVVW